MAASDICDAYEECYDGDHSTTVLQVRALTWSADGEPTKEPKAVNDRKTVLIQQCNPSKRN